MRHSLDPQLEKVRIELFRLPIGGSRETDRPLLPKSRRRRAIEVADVALRGKNLESNGDALKDETWPGYWMMPHGANAGNAAPRDAPA